MKIKRYTAPDMRQAMQKVREDQGPDAVILSSRRVDGMNEIIAAIDYDEALVRQAVSQMRNAAPAPQAPVVHARKPATPPAAKAASQDPVAVREPAPAHVPADEAARLLMQRTLPRKGQARVAAEQARRDSGEVAAAPAASHAAPAAAVRAHGPAAPSDATYQRMQREMTQLRQLLEAQLSSLAWNALDRRQPLRTQVLRDLTRLGIEADVATDILEDLPDDMTAEQSRYLPLGLLSRRLTIGGKDFVEHGGAIALVGPTGAGKTTTIAKLAARVAEKHGHSQVALICTDDYRIGAQDQLTQYGRLLGVASYQARNSAELGKLLVHLADTRVVLIDTPGMNHRDERLVALLDTLRANAGRVRSLLVLPANTQAAALEESLRTYSALDPDGCVLTKLDETPSLGPSISVLIRNALALHYTTDGQRVPQDIAVADARRMVCRLANPTASATVDELQLADRFGRTAVALA